MRGDLEILAYNMLQWIIGELPWEKSLKEPKTVQSMKESFMKNVRSNIQKHKNVPDALIKFFEYINAMKPKDVPDYTKCRKIFETYLKSQGKTRKSKLEFSTKSAQKKRNIDNVNDSDVDDSENEVSKENKIVKKKNNEVKKKNSRKQKIQEDSEESDKDTDSVDSPVEKRNELPTKRKPKKRDINNINDSENDISKENQIVKEKISVVKKKQSRKPKMQEESKEADKDRDSVDSQVEKGIRRSKRKSSEPAVVVKVKKTRLNPKCTPPAKKNHTNIATQTPVERDFKNLRQVSFDSPISEVMGQNGQSSVNSSGDIFDDSFVVEDKKIKKKRKLLSCQETVVKRVVTKRTERKGRSWKDFPTVLNGQGMSS